MRLRHLEIFHAVMRTGSVSGAATLLNLSQSAASKALAQAEHALGLTLFQRVQGRLVHTREAEQLYGQTTLLFAQAENVQRLARNLKRNPEGHLRIGCLPSFGLSVIPGAVKAFRRDHARMPIEVLTGNGDELVDGLLARELDVVVCFDMPLRPALARLPLGRIRVMHVSPDDEADAGRASPGRTSPGRTSPGRTDPVDLQTLDASQWIGLGGSDPVAQLIRDTWDRLQLPESEPVLETRTYYVAAALARQGLGFALVDELTARAMGQGLRMRPLTPPVAVEAVAFHVASDVRSIALDAFIDVLRGCFSHTG
ncbi:LysR family transcriptional regulator [Bordetella genomosp. 13]|uniref:LysR family transcriptional regulator n=1 Tax=Bordetella genomosp. 13 TaxID=463040 RepID=UPI00119F0D22|nr:LysR family transcriptional regulator [Bordetella genomosp. 13]